MCSIILWGHMKFTGSYSIALTLTLSLTLTLTLNLTLTITLTLILDVYNMRLRKPHTIQYWVWTVAVLLSRKNSSFARALGSNSCASITVFLSVVAKKATRIISTRYINSLICYFRTKNDVNRTLHISQLHKHLIFSLAQWGWCRWFLRRTWF